MGLTEDVGVLMWWSWSELWGWAWDVVVLTLVRMVTLAVVLVCVLEKKMAWVVERLDDWCVTGSPGLVESSGRSPKQFPILSLFQQRCVFGQLEKKW